MRRAPVPASLPIHMGAPGSDTSLTQPWLPQGGPPTQTGQHSLGSGSEDRDTKQAGDVAD